MKKSKHYISNVFCRILDYLQLLRNDYMLCRTGACAVVILIMFTSCSNTFEFLERKLAGPRISFDENEEVFLKTDSIKTKFKTGGKVESISFTITPVKEGILRNISVKRGGADGDLFAEGKLLELEDIIYTEVYETIHLTFNPKEIEDDNYVNIDFHSYSTSGKLSSRESSRFTIVIFKNTLPIASFVLIKTDEKYVYVFNAAASRDTGIKFPGKIMQYRYTITIENESHTILSEKVTTNYAFPKSGTYTISLIVVDDDAGESEPTTQTLVID